MSISFAQSFSHRGVKLVTIGWTGGRGTSHAMTMTPTMTLPTTPEPDHTMPRCQPALSPHPTPSTTNPPHSASSTGPAFIGENLLLSSNRDMLVEELGGEERYKQLYGALSTAACGTIAYGFFWHGWGRGPVLWVGQRSVPAMAAAFGLQGLGLVGFSQLFPKLQWPWVKEAEAKGGLVATSAVAAEGAGADATGGGKILRRATADHGQALLNTAAPAEYRVRCPMDFSAPDVPADGVFGASRVSRHHTLWSLGMLGLGTAVATPFAAEIVKYTMPAAFAFIGGEHQDYRYRRGIGGELTPEVDRVTSNVPFVALLRGKQSFEKLGDELKWVNAGVGLTIALGLATRRFVRRSPDYSLVRK